MTSVLHVITGLGPGGAEAQLVQLATALAERGSRQYVVSLTDDDVHAASLTSSGVQVDRLNVSWSLVAPLVPMKLAGILRKVQPAIVQGWMYHGNLAAALAHRLGGGSARLFWNIRASDMDDKRYGRIIAWNARLSSWPERIVTNSRASIPVMENAGFRTDKFTLIANGIDTVRYQPDQKLRKKLRGELGLAEEDVVALLSARVDPMKDHGNFLEAMRGLKGVRGLLVGRDTDTLDLPENVSALGYRGDVETILPAADIIVSSSSFGEGFSNSLAEGMSAGLVPVATDVGDARHIIGDTGRVVSPRDAGALREAIATEAGNQSSQRRERGLAARQRILDNFTVSKAVDTYAELYGLNA